MLCLLMCLMSQSGDSRLWGHVLNCPEAKKSRFCSIFLSMCLQNLSLQYGNSSSYGNVVFFSTGQWNMPTKHVSKNVHENGFGN